MGTVATAIANRYGLPVQAIAQRMAAGRFRVKANVDLSTATKFAAELEQLGAVCSVVEAATGRKHDIGPASTQPTLAAGAAPPVPAAPKSPLPPPSRPAPASDDYQSGLAAAFGTEESNPDIGALDSGLESGSFSLATLDGDDERPPPPPPHVTAPSGGAQEAHSNDNVDLFAPPEADSEELSLAVDVDVAPPPPPPPARLTPSDGFEIPQPVVPASASEAPAEPLPARMKKSLAGNRGVNFAVGITLAMLLGFLAANVFAILREGSVYDTPREKVVALDAQYQATPAPATAEQAAADYKVLSDGRAAQRSVMEDAQLNIAIVGFLIWAVVGGAFGFVWFRRIPWERWA